MYNMQRLVDALARASPDPNVSYRKSQRSQAAAQELARGPNATPSAARTAPSVTGAPANAPTPKRRRGADTQPADEQRRVTLEATTTVTAPSGAVVDVNAEIESAKQLVRDLKRELQMRTAAGDSLEELGGADAESSARGQKRGAEDDGTAISGGAAKGDERVIRTNRRVEQTAGGAAKRVAFGAMLFGLGASAALFLPQLAAQYLA